MRTCRNFPAWTPSDALHLLLLARFIVQNAYEEGRRSPRVARTQIPLGTSSAHTQGRTWRLQDTANKQTGAATMQTRSLEAISEYLNYI